MVSPMERDDHVLPLTRGQLDIWLAHESGHSGTEWQLGLFVRVEGTVKRDLLERAIRQAVQEAEPARAAFFEVDGQVFQKAIDYSDVELAFHDLSGSDNAVQEAREIASSIQRTPMPFTGPLLKFALFRTRPDEFYLFACCHHIVVDGLGIALCGAVGLPLSTLQLFLANPSRLPTSARCRTWWIANRTTKRPPIIWKIRPIGAANLPPESGPDYRLPQAASGRDRVFAFCAGSIGPGRRRPNQGAHPRVYASVDMR